MVVNRAEKIPPASSLPPFELAQAKRQAQVAHDLLLNQVDSIVLSFLSNGLYLSSLTWSSRALCS